MGRQLIVAEKPSVARDIARVLGVKERGNGCIIGDRYVVTWAFGHLVTLSNPEELDEKYKEWSYKTLPIIPDNMKFKITPSKGAYRQFNIIKFWMNSDEIDSLICATDAGREGELIFRRIYEFSECTKPFKRLWISSMTDQAIQEGFATLKDGVEYDTLYDSARCRAQADWLVGMNGSRAFTLTYDRLLSVGRVQSPTLAIIVKREIERQNFVSEIYYELWASFKGYKGRWFDEKAEKDAHRIKESDKEKFDKLAAELKGKPATVENIEKKTEENKHPLLYDLTSLQRDANYYFSWPAAKTLRVAQALYEKHKLITYPRTDSRFLSSDMYGLLKGRAAKLDIEPWSAYAQVAISTDKKLTRVVWDERVTDHHAIIPTGRVENIKKLDEDEMALFDLVVRRFLSIFFDEQVLERITVLTRAEGHAFLSKGINVIQKGWTEIYESLKKKKKKEDEQDLPVLAEGDERKVTGTSIKKKKTAPPARYSDATLLSAMENAGRFVEDETLREQMKENGLGTPATRAAIIERLIQVKYVRRSGRNLVPTEKGMILVSVLPDTLSSPETTGKWEKELNDIRYGHQDADEFMGEIKDLTRDLIKIAKVKVENVTFPGDSLSERTSAPKESLGKCPACDGDIYENSKAFYCSNWRMKRCKFSMWKVDKKVDRPELTPELTKELLDKKMIESKEGTLQLNEEDPYLTWTPKEGAGED